MSEGLILQELHEIKEQLQNISDALVTKKHYHHSPDRRLYNSPEDYDQTSTKEPTKRCTITID